MHKRAVCGFFGAWLLACASSGFAQHVVDDRGIQVQLAKPPQRIVSLLPSLTETVCALGQCQRLVGVDRYSNYPASVRALPRLGGGLDPNIEAIVALRPDVVFMATSSRAHERLTALGLKVVALEPKTHADVKRVIDLIGELLTLDRTSGAQPVWNAIEAGMNAAAQSLPPYARNARVYFEVNRAPYAASESSFIGETLARLGVKNIVPARLGPFPKLNPEFVVRADPDVIMVSDQTGEDMLQRPGWTAMRAVREQRICRFTPDEADVLVRPGPRMAEAAQLMSRCLREKAPT
jgi:iron complex transport system substrate-binding protein